ncbi:hypothetical protein TNCV_3535141 [Trichonephila clavipes]|nr:hypothetical protein TNCV_3535141 [Trichonephila clavipes]
MDRSVLNGVINDEPGLNEWRNVIFSDESRFCLQHQGDRIRVWRHRCERTLGECIPHHHTGPLPGGKQDNARPHVAGIVRTFPDTENALLFSWPV